MVVTVVALRDGVTLFSAVPQMHALLMQYSKEQGLTSLGSDTLRYVSSGAAPLDPTWKRKAEAFYGVAIQNGYGMTETTAGTSATRKATSANRPALKNSEIIVSNLCTRTAKSGIICSCGNSCSQVKKAAWICGNKLSTRFEDHCSSNFASWATDQNNLIEYRTVVATPPSMPFPPLSLY